MTDSVGTELKIGDAMPDGSIYAGICKGKRLYATPADAPLTYTFNQAQEYAAALTAHGHTDWRVPTENELNTLYENRKQGKLERTFNEIGLGPAGWYWSSSQDDGGALAERFSGGGQYDFNDNGSYSSSLRCVR